MYKRQPGLYAIIAIYIQSVALDKVLYGFNICKFMYIVTDKTEEMGHRINLDVYKRQVDINTVPYDDFPIYSSFEECAVKADVIIDFSNPVLLAPLLCYAEKEKTPVVIATTGYSEAQVAEIHAAAENIAVFFTFNMSLGINLLVDLAKKAASVLGGSFDIEIIEKHHNQKIDAPSGTAIMLADAINDSSEERYIYEYDRHSKRQKRSRNEIGILSVRGGTIVGERCV